MTVSVNNFEEKKTCCLIYRILTPQVRISPIRKIRIPVQGPKKIYIRPRHWFHYLIINFSPVIKDDEIVRGYVEHRLGRCQVAEAAPVPFHQSTLYTHVTVNVISVKMNLESPFTHFLSLSPFPSRVQY